MADVFTEIDNLKDRVHIAYSSLSAAGTSIPLELSSQTTWNLSSTISSLAPVQDDWRVPAGWPDLRKVLADDPFKNATGVGGRAVFLVQVLDNGLPGLKDANVDNIQTWGWFRISGIAQNSIGCRTSNDPDTYIANTTTPTQYVWDSAKYIQGINGEKFVWIEIYYNRAYATLGWSTGTYVVASSWPGLVWMCGDGTHGGTIYARFARRLKAVTGFTYLGLQ